MREKLRSGDLYLAESRQHIPFWNMMIDDLTWENVRQQAPNELGLSSQYIIKSELVYRHSIGVIKNVEVLQNHSNNHQH